MKARLAILLAAAVIAALAVAGCGGSSSSSSEPATLAPPKAPLYIEVTLRPEGEQKSNVDALAKSIGGIDDLGGFVVSKLESMASAEGEELDFEKEVEPWLGEKAGISFQSYDGNNFHGYGVAVQSTDTKATQEFIEKRAEKSHEEVKSASYEGVEYKVQEDGTSIGVVGEFLAVGEDEAAFKAMVKASEGESLAGEEDFTSAIAAAPSDSFANLYVDIGGLIEAGSGVTPEAQTFLDAIGVNPAEATAVASVIPGSENIEVDLSSNLSQENLPAGDPSKMLESLPGGSLAALATAEFGKGFEKGIDKIDAQGIPGQIPPHRLKSTLLAAGLNLEKISSSIGDLGVFAEGESEASLGGAVVLEDKSSQEAQSTVANVGLLLRAAGTAGVTAISGKFSGFSIHEASLGRQPLVVAAAGERIAIAYGLAAATRALATNGPTLGESSTFKEAAASLGSTPISGFADGPAALKLATALVPAGDEGFHEAQRYLAKVSYVAIGREASGELSTAKVIIGVGK